MSVRIVPFDEADRVPVIALWRSAEFVRPGNDPDRDFNRKLAVDDGIFFVARSKDSVVGTVMAGAGAGGSRHVEILRGGDRRHDGEARVGADTMRRNNDR